MLETRFLVSDIARLRAIIGGIDEDPKLRWLYPVGAKELAEIGRSFGAYFAPGDYEITLEPWHSIREAPYLIHTGFELALMLDGRKPLAKFSDAYPNEWFEERMNKFTPFVESGRLIRRVVKRPFDRPRGNSDGNRVDGISEVFFALPGEEWRVDAYLLLWQVAAKTKWNYSLERFEGLLLGYEDWQIDWWIEQLRKRRPEQDYELPWMPLTKGGE